MSSSKTNTRAGFSLVEILITLAIVTILTALVMVRYGSFNSVVLLKNQAYEIALDVRDTQVRAVSVRGEGTDFRKDYGIYFSTDTSAGQNKQYILWQDDDSVGGPPPDPRPFYETNEAIGNPVNLDSRFFVKEICVGTDCTIPSISISFSRPDFDAVIVRQSAPATVINEVEIIIAPDVDPTVTRSIFISTTGQITVE